ncbi:hypothetical protein TSTA_006840 [Talaromyces stipitatus ATCC 10500]|uniref:Cytochrome P450 n=1 Tax=Talaromyces stipitatus (strain ATCC 10500 / CBS 375.48 / QM 6759 / NRRL 1006) TaxID=441959 RepID=B8MU34_TALSN|nr:uncharacterized protein TSTA_006840 [Talaromyces stipitatus ATCC 10500]EED12667.1 hypothetical protein TSTA_006840 [Talaromyces stipitatus ATCC 10500]
MGPPNHTLADRVIGHNRAQQAYSESCSQNSHKEILREIQSLRISITTPDPTKDPSYADVACTPPTRQLSNIWILSLFHTTLTTITDTLYCTIDTSKMADDESNRMSAGSIRTAVEKEIRNMENHMNWRCRAVTVDPKNTNRIRIACRDEAEHQLVKKVAEAKIGAGARVLRDELYPIKVTSLAVCNHAFHHNPAVWGEDHSIFNPCRWDDPTIATKSRLLMHFGLCGRQCIGKTVATTNIYKLLSTLLRQFEFELASDLERMNVAKGLYKGQIPEMVSVGISDLKGPLLVKAKNR